MASFTHQTGGACACSRDKCSEECETYSRWNPKPKRIKFVLDGCDICFTAEAPADMTLAQLLKQADRIHPDWCACGIRSRTSDDYDRTEIIFDYDDVRKAYDDVSCQIK